MAELRKPAAVALLLWTALVSPASGGESRAVARLDGSRLTPAQIDEKVTGLMRAAEVPGLALAVINGRQVVYRKGYGSRDVQARAPMTADTVMAGASLSKAAFAYLVMILVEDGVLDLDEPVQHYLPKPLPEYPRYADLAGDRRYERITARMLLSHTSGFANWRAFEDDRKLRIHFEPGSRYAYSGEGIDLLQLVVETVTRTPLEKLAQKRLFGPLRMTRTSYVWQSRFDADAANGYDEYGRSLGRDRPKSADAAGSMQTTVSDFALLIRGVLRGRLLSQHAREEMLRPQIPIRSKRQFPTLSDETTDDNAAIRLSYGLGWGVYASPRGRAFFKEGHDAGWRNYAVAFDASGNGIVILTNSANGEGIFEGILESVQGNADTPIAWEGFTPYDRLPPRPPLAKHEVVKVAPEILRRYVGRYLIPPNVVMTVRWKDSRLTVQENDEPEQDLVPEGPARFFTVAEDVYTFETDAQGRATVMTLHADGREIPAKRMP